MWEEKTIRRSGRSEALPKRHRDRERRRKEGRRRGIMLNIEY
jgi:hypothetical protein